MLEILGTIGGIIFSYALFDYMEKSSERHQLYLVYMLLKKISSKPERDEMYKSFKSDFLAEKSRTKRATMFIWIMFRLQSPIDTIASRKDD